MKILIVNDDGFDAPGIKVLTRALVEVAEVVVIAPLEERSTTGHSLSLHRPLRVRQLGKGEWGVSGFPADCVLIGLGHICRQSRPDLVISGINRGANLGQDIYYSGTVAAAREASFHNIPALAASLVMPFSNIVEDQEEHYTVTAQFVQELVKRGVQNLIPPRGLFNINVPLITAQELKGAKLTTLGFKDYSEDILQQKDPRDKAYFWIEGKFQKIDPIEGSDCVAVEDGFMSLTPLGVDSSLNHRRTRNAVDEDWLQKVKTLIEESSRFLQKDLR